MKFSLKLIVFIFLPEFKISASNSIHDFALFNFFKRRVDIDLYMPLDTPTLNPDHKIIIHYFILKLKGC